MDLVSNVADLSPARKGLSTSGLALIGAATLATALLSGDLALTLTVAVFLMGVTVVVRALAARFGRLERQASALRRTAEALRESEARFRDFATVSSDWFWEQDADLRFSYFSGKQGRDYLGKTPWDLRGDHTGDEVWAAHREVLKARQPFHDFRYERIDGNGQIHYYSISGQPRFDASGTFLGYRGTGRNITTAIHVQESLRLAKEQAEAASRTKSQILATMSHELRTPLNAIIGFSEVIGQGMMGPVDRRYRDYALDIHNAGRHLLKLINDVLDLSKIEVGRLELYEENVDLVAVIDDCRRLFIEQARETHIGIETIVPPGLPRIRADALRLKQIILNLLSNAVKFTSVCRVGGLVSVEVTRAADGGIVIAVVDCGLGMKPEDIPIALSPFRQVEGAMNRRVEGTGLGLPLAKMLAELHGGSLDIESTYGRGTTVRVHLPAARVLPPEAATGAVEQKTA